MILAVFVIVVLGAWWWIVTQAPLRAEPPMDPWEWYCREIW